MMSIKTTEVIEKSPEGELVGSEIHISGNYNRLLGEYEALSLCYINQVLNDCSDEDMKIEFASDFTESSTRIISHLIEEVKNECKNKGVKRPKSRNYSII